MTMTEINLHTTCFLCARNVQVGRHRYDGRMVPAWGIFICNNCRSGNWDGIVTTSAPRLIDHLKSKGIEIKLNAKGWLDIPQ